jgi:hypothetical protein
MACGNLLKRQKGGFVVTVDRLKMCNQNPNHYDFNCADCRNRYINSELCKVSRREQANFLSKRWGDFGDYTKDPHCGCKNQCKRRNAQKSPNIVVPREKAR